MKKVMKKFNRALSIMLVAAMVLTMAPQTAMPVLATESTESGTPQVDEPEANTGDNVADDEGEKEETPVNPADVTEGKTGENSGDLDDTDNGQENEEEEVSTPVVKKTTAVTESTDDSDSNDEETEDPSAEFNAEPNAVEIVEPVSITIKEFPTSPADADPLDEGTIVKPIYLEGESGGQATGGTDLKFQLEVQDGWQANTLAVTARIQTTNTGAQGNYLWETKNPTKSGETYTLGTNKTVKVEEDGKSTWKSAYTGEIEITVKATKLKATLDASDITGGVYLAEAGVDGADLQVATTNSDIDFEKFTDEITLLVKSSEAAEDDTVKLAISNTDTSLADGSNAQAMTRGGEVDKDGVKWTQFTIDPKTLEGYNACSTVDGTSFVVTKTAGATYAVAYVLDTANATDSTGAINRFKFTAAATNDTTKIPSADDINYITLGGDDTVPTAPTGGWNHKNFFSTSEVVDGETKTKRNVLAFVVEPITGSDSIITGVKAVLATNPDAPGTSKELQTIEVPVAGSYEKSAGVSVDYYTIDLMNDIDREKITEKVKLTLKVDLTLKEEDEDFRNHRITFTGDLDNVVIKDGAATSEAAFNSATALPASKDTEAGTFAFSIKPKDGYAISNGSDYDSNSAGYNSNESVVTVTYTKRYELTTGSAATLKKEYVDADPETVELSLTDIGGVGSEVGIFKLTDGTYDGDKVSIVAASNALKLIETTAANGDAGWGDFASNLSQQPSDYNEWNGSASPAAAGNAAFSYKNIIINVRTTTESNQSGYFDVVSNDLEYTVETGNGVEPGDRAGRYAISEEAEFVVLNVTAPAKPVVTYNATVNSNGHATAGPEATPVKDGDTYKVKIPVSSLSGFSKLNAANSSIDSTIAIERGTYAFEVKNVNNAASPADFAGKIKIGDGVPANNGFDGNYSNTLTALSQTRGETVPVVLYAVTGTEFKSVKVVTGTGDDAKEEEITLGEDKTKVELSLAMTANVTVKVTTNNVYGVAVTRDPVVNSVPTPVEKGDDGVYVVPAGAKNIKATLKNGISGTPTIAYAKLYDGEQPAATKPTFSGSVATIGSIDKKDTGVLRLELAVKNGNKIEVVSTVLIRQEQMASKISITSKYDGSTVTEFNQAPDSVTAEYNVKAEEGSLKFSDSEVVMELAADETRTTGTSATAGDVAGTYKIDNSDVKIVFDPQGETLSITAKPSVTGDKSYVLRFYDAAKRAEAAKTNAADRICAVEGGTIDIKIAPPAVKTANLKAEALDATNTTLRIQVSSDNNIALNSANHNNVFYRVTLDSKDKLGTGKTQKVWYEQRNTDGKPQVIECVVNPNTETVKGVEIDYSHPEDFHPTVELVQTTDCNNENRADTADKAANEVVAKTQGDRNKLAKSDAIALTTSTKEARYETELTLSPAKATVYLGQKTTVATTAKFGEKTGFASFSTPEFVNTKTNKNLGSTYSDSEGVYSYYYGMKARYNNTTGQITINATGASNSDLKNNPADFKDLGLRVYATAPGQTKQASAVLALSVVAGVNNISFENGYNQEIYKVSGKKATLKIKAVLNDGVKEDAPKKKKFVYALGDKNGNLPGETGYEAPSPAVLGNVTVNKNNGTVTVAKGFEVDTKKEDNNKFTVVAQEIYSGTTGKLRVTITGTAKAVTSVVIVDAAGNVVAADGVLRADDFYTAQTKKDLYVKALSAEAGAKRVYSGVGTGFDGELSNTNYMTGVKYTSSAKNILSVDPTSGKLTLLKASNKPVKLTVAAADGSKDKGQSISISVQSYSDVALRVRSSVYGVDKTGNDPVVKYDGAANAQFDLVPAVKVNGDWISEGYWDGYGDYQNNPNFPTDYFKNLSLSVKKAKKLSLPKTERRWSIVKTDSVSKVTISDKSQKGVKTAYDITQNPATPAGAKALKVKALTKLTQPMIEAARTAADPEDGKITIKYQITGKDKGLYTNQYVMLTPDYSKVKEIAGVSGLKEYQRANNYFLNGNGQKLIKIGADDTFEFELNMHKMTNQQRIPGTYVLFATAGTYANGTFTPATKGATVKVKIPGKAPKTISLKLNGNFDLDESGAPVSIGEGIDSGLTWWLDGSFANYAKNKIDPETGKANNFTKYFKVVKKVAEYDDYGNPSIYAHDNKGNQIYTLGFKSNELTVDEIAKLRENEKDLQGYVTVETGNERQDMLITVNLVDSVITGVAKDSYKGGAASVQFFANGEAIALAGVSIDQKATQQGTPSVTLGARGDKTAKVTLAKAEKDNKYEVTFKVLAEDSAYARAKNVTNINSTFVEKYGRSVTVSFYVVDPAKTKGSVSFEAVEKDPGLAFTAYSTTTYDKTKNTYSLEIEQKSEIDGAVISAVKIGKNNADGSAFAGTNAGLSITQKTDKTKFTLKLDRDKFLKLADAENATLARGAELAIPVEVTYQNREIPAETITVNVTMPDPMSFDEAVKATEAAVKEAEQIRVVDLEHRDYTDIKLALQNKVNEVLLKAVPLDAVVAELGLPITLQEKPVDPKKPEDAKIWTADISIKEKKTDKEAKKFTLTFAPETALYEADDLADAISDLTALQLAAIKTDNDYTAEMLKADIMELLNIKTLPDDVDIVISDFKIKKATVSANGKVTAKVSVYNAKTKRMADTTTSVTIEITKLGDLGVNGGDIADAVKDKANGGKIDYQQVIYDAMKAPGADLRDVERALEDAILKAANDAIRNSSVTVDFATVNIGDAGDNPLSITGGWDNLDKQPSGNADPRNVAFKLPDSSNDGTVKFKLVVKQSGMKDYTIDKTSTGITVEALMGDDNVAVFQNLSEAENAVKAKGAGKIFSTDADTGEGEQTLADPIDEKEPSDIAAVVEKRAKTLVTGAGLKVSVDPIALFTTVKDSTTAATGKTPGGGTDLYAHGTITIEDTLQRGSSSYTKTVKFVVLIPRGDTATATGIDVKIEKVVGSAKTELTADSSTVPAVDAGYVGGSSISIQFTSKLKGYWLTEADNSFDYSITDTSDAAADATNKLNTGFSINASGLLTITPDQVDDSLKDGTVKTLRIKIAHNKRLKGETTDTGKDSRVYKRDVKIKFTTATTAKTLLEGQTAGSYNWNATMPITVVYEKNASNAWIIVGEDNLSKNLVTKANNWLKAAQQGHDGFTLTLNELKFDNTTAPTKATVKFDIARGSDTATTSALDLELVKSDDQLQKEVDDIADTVEAACVSLTATKATVTDYNETDAETTIKAASGVSVALGSDATLTVTDCNVDADTGVATVKFTVTKNGKTSTERTVTVTVTDGN